MTFHQDNLSKIHHETNINPRLIAISFGRRHPQKSPDDRNSSWDYSNFNYIKIILTYCVPYCVTTWGAIHGKRAQFLADNSSN